MKIAYLFHGHMRTWKECYQSFFDNVFSVAPGDVYIHTWDRTNSSLGSHWNVWHRKLPPHLEKLSAEPIDQDLIQSVYKPKQIIVEKDPGLNLILQEMPQVAELVNYVPSHLLVYNMFKGQYISFQMAKNSNIQYDRYFSCRPDLFFGNKLDITELEQENYLMCPYIPPGHTIFDIYGFGSENVMNIRSKFCNHMWERWYSNAMSGPLRWHTNYDFSVEEAVTEYLLSNGVRLLPSKLKFDIKRMF